MKKGQVSVETVLVVSVITVFVLAAGYVFYSYSQLSQYELSEVQIKNFGNEIVSAVERVQYMGESSLLVVQGRLPGDIVSINLSNDWDNGVNELFFVRSVDGQLTEYVYSFDVNVNSTFFEEDHSAGFKQVHVEAYVTVDDAPFVFINFGGRCPASKKYDLNNDGMVDAADYAVFTTDYYSGNIGEARTRKIWNPKWNSLIKIDYNGDCEISPEDDALIDEKTS